MFLGRQFRFAWLTAWISGIALALAAIALSWTAMSLDWTQLGYWRLNLELSIIQAPVIGEQLRELLIGGEAIGSITLKHFYALHSYVLSGIAIVFSVIQLLGLLIQDRENQHLKTAFVEPTQAPSEAESRSDTNSLEQNQQEFYQPRKKFA